MEFKVWSLNMKKQEQGYHRLRIYNKAHELAVKVHNMTYSLPKFEMYEEGNQIRRSTKSISNNIIEGYALRKYKKEYIHFLYRAYASSEETIEHLKYLIETKSLKDDEIFIELKNGYYELNKMLFRFIEKIESEYKTPYFLVKESKWSNTIQEECGAGYSKPKT